MVSARPARPARAPRWARALLAVLLLLAALLAIDLARPPARQASARLLLRAIAVYQARLSPWLPALGVRCRFEPTCSQYARATIARRGALRGLPRALGRILRCGPWTPQGTADPP